MSQHTLADAEAAATAQLELGRARDSGKRSADSVHAPSAHAHAGDATDADARTIWYTNVGFALLFVGRVRAHFAHLSLLARPTRALALFSLFPPVFLFISGKLFRLSLALTVFLAEAVRRRRVQGGGGLANHASFGAKQNTDSALCSLGAVAGLGGGGIMSLVIVIISDIVPIDKRPLYQGHQGDDRPRTVFCAALRFSPTSTHPLSPSWHHTLASPTSRTALQPSALLRPTDELGGVISSYVNGLSYLYLLAVPLASMYFIASLFAKKSKLPKGIEMSVAG
ncbi:hypothetical protein M427DRAFT_49039 [Gonapodya prolifera JEL478]|uniref:Uncharacterized protein n=1 Tax=Gonapodya prolifera (strain JEL478) TaxID=1344416 RepID=A0A138ZZC9_GONPJ|nr:hypothetical protein M427DRAFT_49039 [Gonapodya prolifera JEL478]|eukprot:KXS09866.1 hypothetical protein M427DRAFT_49039 [Gonapodya prolifera JEL478]